MQPSKSFNIRERNYLDDNGLERFSDSILHDAQFRARNSSGENLSPSTTELRQFLMNHSDLINSICAEENGAQNYSKDRQSELPAELWWVPPLNLPSTRSVPSVAMSARPYSNLSSVSTHARTKRSVEDLRQKVNSVCNLVESMGLVEAEKQSSKSTTLNHTSNRTSLDLHSEEWSVPSLQLPCSASTYVQSEPKQPSLPHVMGSQCSLNQRINCECNEVDSATLRLHSGPPQNGACAQAQAQVCQAAHNAVRAISSPPQSSNFEVSHSTLSVSDLACIHIVNPMLSKLARLCTAQGQQYVSVLEELEKACNEFYKACKSQNTSK